MSKPQQLSEKYTKEIFQEIKSGIYSRADRLPSEPDIAKHFGISEDRAVNYHSDSEGTQLNYEVVSEAICAVRCNAPLGVDWKKRIDEDYNARKDERRK